MPLLMPLLMHPMRAGQRVPHAAHLILDTKRWIQEHYPFWNRKGGKDHIWLFTHDEGEGGA